VSASKLTQDQALAIIKQRQAAQSSLVQFARTIDIPSVPVAGTEDAWELVETELADHHLLTLHALQAMVDGALLYHPDDLAPITQATPEGLLWCGGQTPRGGRGDGGVGLLKVADPSLNPPNPNIPANTLASQRVEILTEDLPEGLESAEIQGDISTFYLRDGLIPKPLVEGIRYAICRRVMIMMPPGSAKSTYASVVFPAWQMGRCETEIILTGWGDPICRRHGKRARTICASDLYRGVMSTWLDPNTRAAEDWALTNKSTYKSSGINSGVAGFRCDGLVWDDLTKNRKEADSRTIRDDTYNAYIDDARSRKKPDAWEVGIGTRWHEEEIMGRILPEGYAGESGYMRCRDGNVWLVICLAAECEREDDPLGRDVGEMIWPEWFGTDYWAEKRVNPRSWGSLYQQRPAPEEGIYFKKEWFKFYDELPEGDNYIAFDPAVSEEEDADDTCIAPFRVDEFARIYLIDDWTHRATMDVWIEQLMRMGQQYKPMEMISETGVIRRASEPFIKRAMLNMKAFFRFEWVHRHADKTAMARAAQGMCASGQFYLPNSPLGMRWRDEMLRFPAGKDDHRVDALANLCLRLEEIWAAAPPKVKEEKDGIIDAGIPIKKLMPPRFPKRKSRWKRTFKTM